MALSDKGRYGNSFKSEQQPMKPWSIIVLASFAMLITANAPARGFLLTDLSSLGEPAAATLGQGFEFRAEPSRLTLVCEKCAGEPIVDIILGKQSDGTEERVRSGATTIADLEELCRLNNDTCRITALDVSAAVGWVSSYPAGERNGATAVIILDGQSLTVRALAKGDRAASAMIKRLLPFIRAKIIGR
jgi:hypothetical protein